MSGVHTGPRTVARKVSLDYAQTFLEERTNDLGTPERHECPNTGCENTFKTAASAVQTKGMSSRTHHSSFPSSDGEGQEAEAVVEESDEEVVEVPRGLLDQEQT
jgi:hypothetical protein